MSRLVAFAAALCIMGCSSTGDASSTEKAKEDARPLNEALRGRGGTVPQDAFLKAVVDNDVQAVREMAKENPSVLSKGYRYSAGMPYAILTRAPMEIALSLHKPEMIATLLELEAPCDADEICAGIWCIQDGPPNTTADDRKKTLDILFQYKPGLLKDKDFCYDLMDRTINFPSPEVLEYLLNKGISAKLENTRELCVQGYGLLQQLAGQPELGGDEPAMHAYLRSSTAAFAAIDNARRNFDEAVERCIAEQIPSAAVFRKRAESDEEKLLREFQPGGIAVSLADVLASAQKKPLRNIPENESQKKVTLNWRSLDSAVYALPEYSRYREAVVEAVQTLSVAMEELEFCLPADICVSEIREMDNFLPKTWKDFWQEQAPDGILVDSLQRMLQTIDMAFDRILSDSWAKELRLLKAEFRANPVKQYNHYYNPK